MNSQHMVHKANQISLFFASYPHDEAVAAVADHFKKFWEPRMRRQLIAYVDAGDDGLHELVAPAVTILKELEAANA